MSWWRRPAKSTSTALSTIGNLFVPLIAAVAKDPGSMRRLRKILCCDQNRRNKDILGKRYQRTKERPHGLTLHRGPVIGRANLGSQRQNRNVGWWCECCIDYIKQRYILSLAMPSKTPSPVSLRARLTFEVNMKSGRNRWSTVSNVNILKRRDHGVRADSCIGLQSSGIPLRTKPIKSKSYSRKKRGGRICKKEWDALWTDIIHDHTPFLEVIQQ